jgi:hypothetical protein
MPIDSNGHLYLSVSQNVAPFFKREQFTDEKGNNCWRDLEIQPDAINQDIFEVETAGWHKTLIYQEINRKEIYLPIEGTLGFRKTTALILSRYLVDVTKNPCSHCNPENITCRIREMPSGLYRRHFSSDGKDITITFFLSTAQIANGAYNLLSEKAVTPKEAKQLIESGQAHCDLNIRRELGLQNR